MPSSMNLVQPASLQQDTRHPSSYLNGIWQTYFSDIPRVNEVKIAYHYPWKNRLGVIRLSLDLAVTFIGINSLLQLPQVPQCVLLITIAHELAHYAHGFGSPLPRRCTHPHANGVVDRELESRDLGEQLRLCNEWVDNHWYPFYDLQRTSGWADLPTTRRPPRQPALLVKNPDPARG